MAAPTPEQIAPSSWLSYLQQTRWFLQTSHEPSAIQLQRAWQLGEHTWLCLVETQDTTRRENYSVPLTWLDHAPDLAHMACATGGVWVDALTQPAGILALHDAIHGRSLPEGLFCDRLESDAETFARSPVVVGSADQTNSWFVVGTRFTKVFRRLAHGENLDVEVLKALATHEAPVPRLRRVLRLAEGTTLCAVQDQVKSVCNGWELACQQVAALAVAPAPLTETAAIWDALGQATACMHTQLAQLTEPEFQVTALEPDFLVQHGHAAATLGKELLDQLAIADLPESQQTAALQLGAGGGQLLALLQEPLLGVDGLRLRVHGDFHLGQVLWDGQGFTILDFEGEPSRSVAERRVLHPAMKDVAGMLRSFDYAARAGLPEGVGPEGVARAQEWKTVARDAFLEGWRRGAEKGRLRPSAMDKELLLTARYELEKAFYELRYELEYRPDWLGIPLGGLLQLLQAHKGLANIAR